MRFELKARISGSTDRCIRQALKQVGAEGEVKKVRDAFAVSVKEAAQRN